MMTVRPGTRLHAYEIVELIGAGGMGEVYRARDTKLGRDVAIKVLPDELASDADRLARFKREAKVLASLNHPNIGAIYGLEEADSTHFVVLELVEGRRWPSVSRAAPSRPLRPSPSRPRLRWGSRKRTSAASCIATSSRRT